VGTGANIWHLREARCVQLHPCAQEEGWYELRDERDGYLWLFLLSFMLLKMGS